MPTSEIAEIVNLINLYPIAVDTQHWDLFDQVFTSDVHADFGGAAVWDGLVPLKEVFAVIHAPFQATQHATCGHQVAVQADTATCLSYVHGRFIRDAGEGGNMFESFGWYDDALIRHSEGWRVSRRICRSLWWAGNPAVLETAPGVKAAPILDSLKVEADAQRLGHINSLHRERT